MQIDKGWQLLITLNLKTGKQIKKTNIQFHDITIITHLWLGAQIREKGEILADNLE